MEKTVGDLPLISIDNAVLSESYAETTYREIKSSPET